MSKIGKLIAALALGLMLSLTLITSGAFAQSVKSNTASNAAQVAIAATAVNSATHAVQTSNVQLTSARWGGWGWGGGWGGGWYGGGWGWGGGWGGCGCGCW